MKKTIPKHVAIIPDGDRRWARERGLNELEGYRVGVERLLEIVERADKLGIEVLTFWGFSTDNWKRSDEEINYLMKKIFIDNGKRYRERFIEKGVVFRHLGRKDRLPKELVDLLSDMEEKTKNNSGKTVCFAIDYGGRDEILRAVKKIVRNSVKDVDIDEKVFSNYLDTFGIPDPDMIIRTSGEYRLSGYLPWQSIYSELFFIREHFPDLTADIFEEIVTEFSRRSRRKGK